MNRRQRKETNRERKRRKERTDKIGSRGIKVRGDKKRAKRRGHAMGQECILYSTIAMYSAVKVLAEYSV